MVDRDDLKEVWASLGTLEPFYYQNIIFIISALIGSPITDAEIDEMLKRFPRQFEFHNVLAILGDHLQVYSVASPAAASDLTRAFEQLDLQKTGRIDVSQFKEALMTMGIG